MDRLALGILVVAAGVSACATPRQSAPYTDPIPTCRGRLGPTGRLRVTVRTMPDGELARGAIVDIDSVACHGIGYAAGVVRFPAVPVGTYPVHVRNWGGRVDTIAVIRPDSETRLAVVVPEFDALRWVCGPVPFCAALTPESLPGPTMTPTDSLRAAALRTTLLLMRGEGGIEATMPVCLSLELKRDVDPSPALLRNLQHLHPALRPASACTFAGSEQGYVERTSGHAAARLSLRGTRAGPGRHRTVTAGYYLGPLYSAEWGCEYAREAQQWRVVRCPHELVS